MKNYVALLIRKEGRTLLVRESNGLWGPPGGHVESGESLFQAALREGREETGLSVTFTNGSISTAEVFETIDGQAVVFLGEVAGRLMVGQPTDPAIIDTGWFTEDEIHYLFETGQLRHPRWNIRYLVDRHTPEEC